MRNEHETNDQRPTTNDRPTHNASIVSVCRLDSDVITGTEVQVQPTVDGKTDGNRGVTRSISR